MEIKVITWPNVNWQFLRSLKDGDGQSFADTFKQMPCSKNDPLVLAYVARTLIDGISSDTIDAGSEYLGLMYGTYLVTDFKMAVIDEFATDLHIHHVYSRSALIFSIGMYQLIKLRDVAPVWKDTLEELCSNASFDKWIRRTWKLI
jgi:hypothetical protein